MKAENVWISSGDIKLEAEIRGEDLTRGGVVTHPHPLYGGSMYDYVVSIAVDSLARTGWTSLRFNFRGVGRSEGSHDNGSGEVQDLVSAAAHLKQLGVARPLIIGYSFGAWIAVKAWPELRDLAARPLVLIAPPAAFMNFDFVEPDTEIGLIICGEHDEIASPDRVRNLSLGLDKPIEPVIIPGTDHFFGGADQSLARSLVTYLSGLE